MLIKTLKQVEKDGVTPKDGNVPGQSPTLVSVFVKGTHLPIELDIGAAVYVMSRLQYRELLLFSR